METLTSGDADVHKQIHETRKSIKRLRAVLRLGRRGIGGKVFRREDAFLSGVAKTLSDTRDMAAMLSCIEKLAPQVSDDQQALLRQLSTEVTKQAESAAAEATAASGVLIAVTTQFQEARERLGAIQFHADTFKALEKSLKEIYRDGRSLMGHISQEGDANMIHQWRKKAKHLWYDMLILSDIWPAVTIPLASEIHALAETLGFHHDLEVLLIALDGQTLLKGKTKGKTKLIKTVRDLQETMLRQAMPLGGKIYSLKTGSFVDCLNAWWNIWRLTHTSLTPAL
ncbi:MAG: CHAD domain-containing protein [Bacteroidia bacterium]|nr:CHAD domain-containing protein [Bacteroidia bacterium]